MFEVLVYVYENFWRSDALPQPERLGRKLSAAGFEPEEIELALRWLGGLDIAATQIDAGLHPVGPRHAVASSVRNDSVRVYRPDEQDQLGVQGWSFIEFLHAAGVLPVSMREIVIERALAACNAACDGPIELADLKVIILMVYWQFGEEPDALVLDELCDDASARLPH
jgi:Smg protein